MNLIMLLLTIIISIVVVRLEAIAFPLTGLEWSIAKFQSLSCFSGTGFTTAEAELKINDRIICFGLFSVLKAKLYPKKHPSDTKI